MPPNTSTNTPFEDGKLWGQSGWSAKILDWLNRRIAKSQYKQCHRIAFRICAMGFMNGEAQKHLDAAKDALYSAARQFKKESEP